MTDWVGSGGGKDGDGKGRYDGGSYRGALVAAKQDDFRIVEPENAAVIIGLAGEENAEELLKELLAASFDAANSTVGYSENIENAFRNAAAKVRARFERLERYRKAQPEIHEVATSEYIAKRDPWKTFWGWFGLIGLCALMVPIPLLVAQGIAQSFALDVITDDWRLGIPVGLPVLGGILAAGLLRQTLTHGAKLTYDRIISVAGMTALAGWTAGYAYTFLAPFDPSGALSGETGTDLRMFYGLHLGLEVTAALGLTAMVERAFFEGRKIKQIVNDAVGMIGDLIEEVLGHEQGLLRKADTCNDRRARLAAARTAYINKGLIQLKYEQRRRSAAMAQAGVNFSNPTIH